MNRCYHSTDHFRGVTIFRTWSQMDVDDCAINKVFTGTNGLRLEYDLSVDGFEVVSFTIWRLEKGDIGFEEMDAF